MSARTRLLRPYPALNGRACGLCRVSRKGYQRLEAWARAFSPVRAFGIEGTGSYGAGLTRSLQMGEYRILEVNWPDRSVRRRKGKDDTIDAEAAARAVLSGQEPEVAQ
jgi:transposase